MLSTISGVAARPGGAGGRRGRTAGGLGRRGGPGRLAARRALEGGGGVVVGGSGRDPLAVGLAAGRRLVDVVVERRGGAFGSGSHPTTQMCVALMLELEPRGGAADLGCGVGTLAIAAAKLGWAPVVAVDRVPIAIEVARENVERNGVEVACDGRRPGRRPGAAGAAAAGQRAAAGARAGRRRRWTAEVRHVIVSGIVAEEVEAVLARLPLGRLRGGQRAGHGGRVDRAALELLSPDRAAAEGAALGQLACELPGGGLLITASRLVEFGARAAILLAPGLFRLDFTPQEETLGLYPRALCDGRGRVARRTRRPGTAIATRSGPAPIELAGRFDADGLQAWIHVLSFTERDALATHFVAKAEIRWTSRRC